MNRIIILQVILLSLASCNPKSKNSDETLRNTSTRIIDSTEMTNNFYDNTKTYSLPVEKITVEGEIENPGGVDFSSLTKHSVLVKEAILDSSGGNRFTGAFRYDGYSLFDILEKRIIKKRNVEEFPQVIDLFVEVENDRGERAIFSWGEIYYPNNLHKIIVATDVSRIVPSRTKEQWILPEKCKVVAACDLITERNLSNPVRITVKSIPLTFNVVKGMSPLYSSEMRLFISNKPARVISSVPREIKTETYNTVFYGRGKGIHSTTPFTGVLVKEILRPYFPVSRGSLRSGLICIAGKDGYRSAFSYSEIFNRNDQQEFLLVSCNPGEDGGLFRLFAACDFFSDRAVKSVSEVHLGY